MNIGARLREERERLGYSQTEFASIGGASKGSQISWEKGTAFPNAEFLAAAALKGVDILYVVTGLKAVEVQKNEPSREAIRLAVQGLQAWQIKENSHIEPAKFANAVLAVLDFSEGDPAKVKPAVDTVLRLVA